VDVWIDGDTGYRAGPECLHVMRAAFVRKTEPRQMCPVMHLPFWSDSLPPDSTRYEEPQTPEETPGEEHEPPAETAPDASPTPSDDAAGAGGAGAEVEPGN
jgi:hypothetical protein